MLKKNDFIEIEYTGTIKEENKVFDTTDKKIAEDNNIFNQNIEYKPIIICVGQNQIIPGLDEELIGKGFKKYTITLPPEKAFGKKDPKLLQLVSQSSFKKQNITPYPGLQVNLDNSIGTIRTVTPGRIIIDFNHPLAGRTLTYELKINKQIKDPKTQLDSLLYFLTKDFKTEIKDSEAIIKAKIPKQIHKELEKKITTLIPSLKKITIEEE